MKLFTTAFMIASNLVVVNAHAQQSRSFTGMVERVWKDGFRLNAGSQILRVDSWDLCGDFTANRISVGDQLTVIGEFEGREFDALSITNPDGTTICRQTD